MFNYFTPPGEILKEYMDEYKINQKELASITKFSERHISQVVNAKARITEEFALKLEDAFPDVQAEFWLDLETKYQLFLLRNKDSKFLKKKEIIDDYRLDELFKGHGYTDNQKVEELLKIVKEPDPDSLNKAVELNQALYMHDGGNNKLLYLWLKLCEEQIDLQNNLENMPAFNYEKFLKEYEILKSILYTQDYEFALHNARRLLNRSGIGLVLLDAIPNSKVRGAVTKHGEHLVIYLSTRYKRIDSLYFALIHEVYHIVNKDFEKETLILSYEESEQEIISNKLASNFFISDEIYKKIVKEILKKGITEEELAIQAKKHKVVIDILIGFLQRDGHIKYSEYNYLRNYIK